MEISLAGRLLRSYTEIRAVVRDVRGSFIGGVTTVLLIVMLYLYWKSGQSRRMKDRSRRSWFRLLQMPAATLLIAIPLGMSLTWTFATAYLAFGTLNLMTSTLILVLFGLGIDYGIHYFARYAEERSSGLSVDQALDDAFVFSGPPITVSALTTAISLYVLMFADFRGFSQFGFIAGTGIMFALIAMVVVLPVLIRVFTTFGLLRIEHMEQAEIPWAARADWRFPRYRTVLTVTILAAIVSAILVPGLRFEYRFGELEPEFEEYRAVREKVRRVYRPSGKRNPAYVVVDREEHIHEVSAILEARRVADSLSPTIRSIESLQNRFPTTPEAQARRLARLAEMRTLLDDPFLNTSDSEDLGRVRRAAQTTAPIALESVPEHLKNQFASRNGEFGRFLLVYPSVGLSDGRNSMAFGEDIGTIALEDGTEYHATSTSIVASDMLRLMLQESPWMVAATFLMVILLMFLVFGSFRWAILALVPLAIGFLLMTAFMDIFSVRLNFYNLVVLPAVLGIGNDCGVHLVYRYREEGPGGLFTTLRSAGEHVTVGLVTTMIGFAWWMFSYHPGLNSIGVLAVIGLGCVLVSALVILPAIIQWREDVRERRGADLPEPDPEHIDVSDS
jgi:predicted RND superfamily exporter protein